MIPQLFGCITPIMNMQPNILITSAGKRVELVLEFQKELKSTFPEGKVLTVDLNPEMAPACHVSDGSFRVPRVTDKTYIKVLLQLCRANNVKIIVPTIDTELIILANAKERFKEIGVDVMVSDPGFIQTCRDKRLTEDYFTKVGIRIPEARDKYNPIFPMFAKPYDGSLSTNLHVIKNATELTPEILSDPKLMFMELIDKSNYKEFTVDMYYERNGRLASIVPRERIEVRSGEVNKGAARKNYLVGYLKERLGYQQGVRGCICVQLFYNETNNDVVGIEINPRFGGGYPLSYYAGANFPHNIISEYLCGKDLKYDDDWQDGTVMLRYDSQVIFHQN